MNLIEAMSIIQTKIWYGDFKNILETFSYSYVLSDIRQLAKLAQIEYKNFLKLAIKSQLMGAFCPIEEIKNETDFIRACDLVADLIAFSSHDDDTKSITNKILLAFYVNDFCSE
jgi:hypothetical protein